jgi:hypothetical protein
MTGPGGPTPDARVLGALGSGAAAPEPSPGVRVVLDARPLQEPGRAPVTAAYLDGLLGAFDQEPIDGESFASWAADSCPRRTCSAQGR